MHPTQHSPHSQSAGSGPADLVDTRQREKTVSSGPAPNGCGACGTGSG